VPRALTEELAALPREVAVSLHPRMQDLTLKIIGARRRNITVRPSRGATAVLSARRPAAVPAA
jgi:hypothetical protein